VNATVNGSLLGEDLRKANSGSGQFFIATKLQLTEATRVDIRFPDGINPTGFWIDGETDKDFRTNVELKPGIHTIVIRAQNIPDPFRIQSNSGTFLPEW
jgi:hypothetical protein